MACGLALKRPHDYDSYLVEEGFTTEAKRARHAATHCSPFRPQMGTIAASLPSTSSFAQSVAKRDANSAFPDAPGCQLTSAQIGAYLRSEIRNLKRRRLIPKRTMTDAADHSGDENNPVSKYRVPNSPTQSGSDSEGECSPKKNTFANLSEKPQFSLKQVQLICERLLKEQEIRLRHEYETALNQRLDEQHEQYVQFAEDQLAAAAHIREKSAVDLSYLS